MTIWHPLLALIPENTSVRDCLSEAGFDAKFLALEDDKDNAELWERYSEGRASLEDLGWQAQAPDGYEVIGQWDTEDGPFACFVKPNTPAAAALFEAGRPFMTRLSATLTETRR